MQKINNRIQFFPASDLREALRQQSVAVSARLGRSVARLTSCEAQPCLEYGEEVRTEEDLIRRLLYLQHCREALERCIAGARVTVSYRKPDGSRGRTTFRKEGPNRVKVQGLVTE